MEQYHFDWPNLIAGSIITLIVGGIFAFLRKLLSDYLAKTKIYVNNRRKNNEEKKYRKIKRLANKEENINVYTYISLAFILFSTFAAIYMLLSGMALFVVPCETDILMPDFGCKVRENFSGVMMFLAYLMSMLFAIIAGTGVVRLVVTLRNAENFESYEKKVEEIWGKDFDKRPSWN